MAESLRDRLQPSLLDRLTDNQPDAAEETYEQATISDHQLRASVLRDLAWLLNTHSDEKRLAAYPRAARSVLNYGLPDLSGKSVGSLKREHFQLEQALLQIVKTFEPRIKNPRISLDIGEGEAGERTESSIALTIYGDLWGYPASPIYLRTEFDVESGDVTIEELTGR